MNTPLALTAQKIPVTTLPSYLSARSSAQVFLTPATSYNAWIGV